MTLRRFGVVALALALFALVAAIPATAGAGPVRAKYQDRYDAVVKRFGERAPGRNIVKWDLRSGREPARATIRRSSQVLKRMLHPPAPVAAAPTPVAITTSAPAITPSSGGSGGLPACTWQPESGGDYDAVNPSSGAYGKYQVIPSTWAAHCSDLGRDPAGQDECAERIWEAQGSGAWVNC